MATRGILLNHVDVVPILIDIPDLNLPFIQIPKYLRLLIDIQITYIVNMYTTT